MQYTKQTTESEEEFIWRICNDRLVIGTWNDVADIINKELGYEYTESKYRKTYQAYCKIFDKVGKKNLDTKYLKELEEKEEKLFKQQIKTQDKIREYRSYLREDARSEFFWELITEAIEHIQPLKIPEINIKSSQNNISNLLLIADQHYDVVFKLAGLEDGEILNEYNPEIFEQRMWKLLEETVCLCEKSKLNQLTVFSLGDSVEGIIAIRQLMSLRYGLVESCIKYSDFMANWLNKLSEYVAVDYYSTFGNHTMLRLLDGKKETLPHENMQKIIDHIIDIRTDKNMNLNVHKNNSEKIYTQIQGFNILGIHGEEKDADEALKGYSNIYGKNISYITYGHKHHPKSETVGFCKGTIATGSIMGTDEYAVDLKSGSNACAIYCLFEKEKGKIQENIINL